MKKVICGLFIMVLSLVLLSGCGNRFNNYTSISFYEFNAKKENKESFPLVIGSSTCSACAKYKITMDEFIQKYQTEVFYIDISKLSDDEYSSLKTEISFDGTPTTVFYEEGKLTSYYNRLSGAEDIDTVINIFKDNGYLR